MIFVYLIVSAFALLGVFFCIVMVQTFFEDNFMRRRVAKFNREHPEEADAFEVVSKQEGVANWTPQQFAKALFDERERRGLI